ncbi:hypothetical protein OF83DRAFT_1176815 [Amylostereum chailletii]|nr:hypothetical protein OF83DRAFT_1176815 [Amylostereum chailletii]
MPSAPSIKRKLNQARDGAESQPATSLLSFGDGNDVDDAASNGSTTASSGGAEAEVSTDPVVGSNSVSEGVAPASEPESDIVMSPDWSAQFVRRIVALRKYANPGANIYTVTRLPGSLLWSSSTIMSSFLRKASDDSPFAIWLPSTIQKLYLFDEDGSPHRRAAITVAPLSRGDLIGLRALIRAFSSAGHTADPIMDIRASSNQGVRARGSRALEVIAFDQVFDAKESLTHKAGMLTLDASLLSEGDVVVQEMTVSRYCDKWVNKKPTQDSWKVAFDLRAIYVLMQDEGGATRAAKRFCFDVDSSLSL